MGDVFKGADERLANRIGESASTISQSAAEAANAFAAAEERVIARVSQSAKGMEAQARVIAEALSSADERVLSGAKAAAAHMDARLADAGSRLSKSVEDATALVDTSMVDIEGRMTNSAETLGRKVAEHVASAEEQLISRADVISNTFSAVGKHIGDSTNDAARVLATNTRELNALMTERTAEINKLLDDTARPLAGKLSDAHVELERTVETAAERAAEKLRSENQALADALASRTAETLAAVDGARNSLSTGVNELIGRMSASSAKLGQADRCSQREPDQGGHRSDDDHRPVRRRDGKGLADLLQLGAAGRLQHQPAHRTVVGTLREVASIATRFEEHSRLLTSASQLLSSAQSNLEHTLERQSALEDLAVGLVKKSEDLENILKSFENLVGNTLEKAEGQTLASTDKIRAAITDVVDSATKRFADATEEMRRTASSIKGDLDATRAELKKGVLDMPQEAKESTTAIRRAVGEQIKALKELSDIVAKSGRTIDVSDKGEPQVPRRLVPQGRPPERQPEPAPKPEPAAKIERQPEPAPKADAPRPRDGDVRPKTGAWVRDLLSGAARAEDEETDVAVEAPRAPARDASPLGSLSVDIARAVDHEAALDIWRRYRQGERGAFSRRLYTLKGQQTFEDIRRRYQSDATFRGAVDRYCEDFERLLTDISRSDRDGGLDGRLPRIRDRQGLHDARPCLRSPSLACRGIRLHCCRKDERLRHFTGSVGPRHQCSACVLLDHRRWGFHPTLRIRA